MKLALIVAFATLTAACASNNTNTTTDEEPTEQSEAAKPDDSPEVDPNPQTIIDLFATMSDRRSAAEFYREDATFAIVHSALVPPGPMPIEKMKQWDEETWAMSSDIQIRPLRITDVGENTYLVETYATGTFDGEMQTPRGPVPPTNERFGMSMLWIYTFDDAGKVETLQIWRNELAMMVDMGVMPSPTGEPSIDPPMPQGETVVQKVDAETNQALLDAYDRFEGSVHARPWSSEVTAAMIHDDVEIGMPVRADVDKARWLGLFQMFAGGMSEMSYEVHRAWTVGDLLIVEATGKATHSGKLGGIEATNKRIENPWFDFLTFRDGKVVKFNGYNNPLFVMKGLGLGPPQPTEEAAAK